MKYIAAAIVAIGLIAADLLSRLPALHQTPSQIDAWAQFDSMGLIAFAALILWGVFHDRDSHE